MAKYSGSHFGTMRKKIGDAVARKWRNLRVAAIYQPYVSNPRTTAQQVQRTIFAELSKLAMLFAPVVNLGLKSVTDGTKNFPRSKFMSLNKDYVHCTVPGTATVDNADLIVAMGNLNEFRFGTASFATPLTVTVPNTAGSTGYNQDADDLGYIAVYSPEAGAVVLGAGKKRSEASLDCEVPDYWVGQRVHVYGFCIGKSLETIGKTSNSRYLGSGTIS